MAYNLLHKLGTKQEPLVRPGDRVSKRKNDGTDGLRWKELQRDEETKKRNNNWWIKVGVMSRLEARESDVSQKRFRLDLIKLGRSNLTF